jgi:DNA-binding transcriptional regulator LsrR (DeoR family)
MEKEEIIYNVNLTNQVYFKSIAIEQQLSSTFNISFCIVVVVVICVADF